jgi:hypothetical protein
MANTFRRCPETRSSSSSGPERLGIRRERIRSDPVRTGNYLQDWQTKERDYITVELMQKCCQTSVFARVVDFYYSLFEAFCFSGLLLQNLRIQRR